MIARYIYNQAPPTYQVAHFTDWIRAYLEYQKNDMERSNYIYVKDKYQACIKCLEYLERFENEYQSKFKQEEVDGLKKAEQEDELFNSDVRKDWFAYQNPEVIEHFPPQLIIGKQVGDDKELLVYDEDPLVRVTLTEVTCEYNYSNPTSFFNLSIPHIDIRTHNYTTLSYAQFKKNIWEGEQQAKKKIAQQKAQE